MAGMIPDERIEEIRKANDIVDIVGEYVSLKKKGRNYFGLCPFHGENTPSFSVTKEKQIYHCFGCGKGGNVFSFLMDIEGFTFYQALEHLAKKSGIELPEVNKQEANSGHQKQDQETLEAFDLLTTFYNHLLIHTKAGEEAKAYLIDRGLSEETMHKFMIGFSPHKSEVTTTLLENKSFNLQKLVKSGLLNTSSSDDLLDPFRGRIIFPIRNHLGRTVGFGGRNLTGEQPKYLNSPDSDLFQKGKLLFNFDLARSEMKKANQVIIFEGYMDVISAEQFEITNSVASLGTAITEHQATLLKRYVDKAVICYDGDDAGINAAFKSIKILKKAGLDVRIASIPEQLDPDSYLQKYGRDKFYQIVIEPSSTAMSFQLQHLKKEFNLSIEADQMAYIERAIEEIATLDRLIEREHYVRLIADEFNLSADSLLNEVNSHVKVRPHNQPNRQMLNKHLPKKKRQELFPAFHNAERKLISYMLYDESIAEKVKHKLGAGFKIDLHKVIVTHLYGFYEEGHAADVGQFIERLNDEPVKQAVIELAMSELTPDVTDQEIDDYMAIIEREQGDVALVQRLLVEQKEAQNQKDFLRAVQIGMEIVEIKKRLK